MEIYIQYFRRGKITTRKFYTGYPFELVPISIPKLYSAIVPVFKASL